jgi:hypothetical protein
MPILYLDYQPWHQQGKSGTFAFLLGEGCIEAEQSVLSIRLLGGNSAEAKGGGDPVMSTLLLCVSSTVGTQALLAGNQPG